MRLSDRAIIVHSQPYAERDRIVTAFSRDHGLIQGLMKQYKSQRDAVIADVGVVGDLQWHARLPEHLGSLKFEASANYAALCMQDRTRLCMLASACALVRSSFALHDPHPVVFDGLLYVLACMSEIADKTALAKHYIAFECALLEEAGFGLDLFSCAATGVRENLRYVSPKSGRAVSASAGEPYADRLLSLPEFMCREDIGDASLCPEDIIKGLNLTGYFIAHSLQEISGKPVPQPRLQLAQIFT